LPSATASPINMWGSDDNNVAADGPNCGSGHMDINCDTTSAIRTTQLANLQGAFK